MQIIRMLHISVKKCVFSLNCLQQSTSIEYVMLNILGHIFSYICQNVLYRKYLINILFKYFSLRNCRFKVKCVHIFLTKIWLFTYIELGWCSKIFLKLFRYIQIKRKMFYLFKGQCYLWIFCEHAILDLQIGKLVVKIIFYIEIIITLNLMLVL